MLVLGACEVESPDAGAPPLALADFAHDLNTSKLGGTEGAIVPWPGQFITYGFDQLDDRLDESTFRSEVSAAFEEWSRVTDNRVTFAYRDDPAEAQILIGFRPGDHVGDGECEDAFTDAAQTIAHVFTYDNDCLAGVIHLNQDLRWVMNLSNEKGTYDVRYAILHEVGHLLGLGHVIQEGHIMSITYTGVVRKLTEQEGADAIAALEGGSP